MFPFSGAGGVGVLVALCAGEDGGEGAGCGDGGEGGRGDGRSICTGAVVLAISLMSVLRHRTTPCSASPNVFFEGPAAGRDVILPVLKLLLLLKLLRRWLLRVLVLGLLRWINVYS